jgi:hypothetical protein
MGASGISSQGSVQARLTHSEIEGCLLMQVNHDTGQPRVQVSDSLVT